MASGVLVYADHREGSVLAGTKEALGAARRLADQIGGPVSAALIGNGVAGLAQELIQSGADTVYVADAPALDKYTNATYLPALDAIVSQADPAVVLFSKSLVTLDLAPRFAFRRGVGLANDVIDLKVENGQVIASRPVYGGSAMAEVLPEGTPQMFTIRGKTQEPLTPDPSRQGNVVPVSVTVSEGPVKVIDQQKERASGPKLQDATRIVSGGRGIGEAKENWRQLEELAEVLGGAVGASRAAVDAGWVPTHMQIGLTGTTVSPDLYIAVAISGAVQHMAGCSGAKTIVAINKDPEAAIFKQARFGVEGDWKKIIPALTKELKAMM
ncbi:MAG: electron transfer flavoprotein subunit alpha [Dehalococcoidia bacterium]|nr:MAG: electron transfer flavoprotein subunit alpha [Dehalococcoidia bacterium]